MHTCGCYRLQVGHTCTSRAEGRFASDGKRGGEGGEVGAGLMFIYMLQNFFARTV